MPRPRTPTKILALNGAFKKNPARARARAHEPKPIGPIGKPPSDLHSYQLLAWKAIVAADTAGVLTSADRLSVELCASLWARHKNSSLEPAERSQLINLLAAFGMTPRGRTYVKGNAENRNKPANPFDE